MNPGLTEEQEMLREAIARLLARQYPFERRQAAVASGDGFDHALWDAFADELCLLGGPFPEGDGGLGGSFDDVLIVTEELGRALAAEPYFGSVVVGGQFLAQSGTPGARAALAELIAGRARFALAHGHAPTQRERTRSRIVARRKPDGLRLRGTATVVYGAPWATHLIVIAAPDDADEEAAAPIVGLLERGQQGVHLRSYRTIDGGRAADIEFDDVPLPESQLLASGEAGQALVACVLDYATVAQCAEGVGLLRELCAQTVDYARERRQFGQPIATYQVIRHRIVDMHLALEESTAITALAGARLGDDAFERTRAAAAAKWRLSTACRSVGESAIQIHGAIGTTDELALGHYFKRALVVSRELGSADAHRRRYEREMQLEDTR